MDIKQTASFCSLLKKAVSNINLCVKDGEAGLFHEYTKELLEWNKKVNLTAITGPEDIIVKHFVDSLSALKFLFPSCRLADIGSGAGFPGIPLKIMDPSIEMVLIESIGKKASFLDYIIKRLELNKITVYNGRVETFRPDTLFDFVLSRAFSSLSACVELSLPLLKKEGHVVALRGREGLKEARELKGCRPVCVESLSLPFKRGKRTIVVVKKE